MIAASKFLVVIACCAANIPLLRSAVGQIFQFNRSYAFSKANGTIPVFAEFRNLVGLGVQYRFRLPKNLGFLGCSGHVGHIRNDGVTCSSHVSGTIF